LVNGTQLLIKIKQQESENMKLFLASYPGYYNAYPTSNDGTFCNLETQYINYYFEYFERRALKRAIRKRGGELIEVSTLGRRPPKFSDETKRLLRNSAIVSAITFLAALGGNKAIASLDLNSMLGIAIIPAVTAFFTRIALDLKISSPSEEKK
jgi:hypothetical protein